MNIENPMDMMDTPKPTDGLMLPKIKISAIKTNAIMCPAKMLANKRTNKANGLVNVEINSIIGIKGKGNFSIMGTSGQKISRQYSREANIFVIKYVNIANTIVIAMLPVTFAPKGKNGINPIKLAIRIKKKTVSR